jgi:hypothetical protein
MYVQIASLAAADFEIGLISPVNLGPGLRRGGKYYSLNQGRVLALT